MMSVYRQIPTSATRHYTHAAVSWGSPTELQHGFPANWAWPSWANFDPGGSSQSPWPRQEVIHSHSGPRNTVTPGSSTHHVESTPASQYDSCHLGSSLFFFSFALKVILQGTFRPPQKVGAQGAPPPSSSSDKGWVPLNSWTVNSTWLLPPNTDFKMVMYW